MKYNWEKKHSEAIQEAISAANAMLPMNLQAMALVVENVEQVEAATIAQADYPTGGIMMADLWKDAHHDAQVYYEAALRKTFDLKGGDV